MLSNCVKIVFPDSGLCKLYRYHKKDKILKSVFSHCCDCQSKMSTAPLIAYMLLLYMWTGVLSHFGIKQLKAKFVGFINRLVNVSHHAEEYKTVDKGQAASNPVKHERPVVFLAGVLGHGWRSHCNSSECFVVQISDSDKAYATDKAADCAKK